jgi:hypothetical protein
VTALPAARLRHRRRTDPSIEQPIDHFVEMSNAPAERRSLPRSTAMFGQIHQELARQRYREAYIEARRARLARAVRAERRARRAVEIAVRASERAGHSSSLQA